MRVATKISCTGVPRLDDGITNWSSDKPEAETATVMVDVSNLSFEREIAEQ